MTRGAIDDVEAGPVARRQPITLDHEQQEIIITRYLDLCERLAQAPGDAITTGKLWSTEWFLRYLGIEVGP